MPSCMLVPELLRDFFFSHELWLPFLVSCWRTTNIMAIIPGEEITLQDFRKPSVLGWVMALVTCGGRLQCLLLPLPQANGALFILCLIPCLQNIMSSVCNSVTSYITKKSSLSNQNSLFGNTIWTIPQTEKLEFWNITLCGLGKIQGDSGCAAISFLNFRNGIPVFPENMVTCLKCYGGISGIGMNKENGMSFVMWWRGKDHLSLSSAGGGSLRSAEWGG